VTCSAIQLPGGGTAIVCQDGRRQPCRWCSSPATKLCDGPPPQGSRRKTCDAPMCVTHAEHVEGQDLDRCPDHRQGAAAARPGRPAPARSTTESVDDVLARARDRAGVTEVPRLPVRPARADAAPEGSAPSLSTPDLGGPGRSVEDSPAPAHAVGGGHVQEEPQGSAPGNVAEPQPGPASAPHRAPGPPPTPAAVQHAPAVCKSCSQPILWALVLGDDRRIVKMKTPTKPQVMPVDWQPDPAGRVVVLDRHGTIVAYTLRKDEPPPEGARTRTAHHQTCKHADHWRAASRERRRR